MPPQTDDGSPITASKASDNLLLTSGFKIYPNYRDEAPKHPEIWLKGKAEADNVYPYWRVHDKLYDLTSFMDKHPGGKFWIEATQGTDITESFESSHFGNGPNQWLKKFYVKDVTTPRNSPFTFKQDGFYMTLKRKVTPILAKSGMGPTWKMLFIQDSLLFGVLFFFLQAAWHDSVLYAVLGGVLTCLAAITSHNFFHQRDNWRMYIFSLTLLSTRDWRISHAISHHLFPNTIYDYEISGFEPILEFLPRRDKSFIYRYFNIVLFTIMTTIGFHLDLATKVILLIQGKIKKRLEYFIPLMQILVMVMVAGSVTRGLWLWVILQTSCNIVFLWIGLTAAHHHPEIYHEGDAAFGDKDWGLHQIAATRDRREIMSSLFLISITFGNHILHHLFPTVDHSKLPLLMPAFQETCKEFGVKIEYFTIKELFKGAMAQIANMMPNINVSKCLK